MRLSLSDLIPWRNKTQDDDEERGADTALARLRNEIETAFDWFVRDPFGQAALGLPASAADWLSGPRVELSETADELIARAELPGVDPKDLDIRIDGGLLTLRGEKRADREEQRGERFYSERQYGAFTRRIAMPTSFDASSADATFKNGVLTITLKKSSQARAKKVPVRNA